MNSHPTHASDTYRVLVTDQITPGLTSSDGRHYESPPQSHEQAPSLIAMLGGADHGDDCGPWRQAIAGGQRLIELKADQ